MKLPKKLIESVGSVVNNSSENGLAEEIAEAVMLADEVSTTNPVSTAEGVVDAIAPSSHAGKKSQTFWDQVKVIGLTSDKLIRVFVAGSFHYFLTADHEGVKRLDRRQRDFVYGVRAPANPYQIVGTVDGFEVPHGGLTIFGGSDSAKSPLVAYFTETLNGEIFEMGEPTGGSSWSEISVIDDILRCENSVIGIDSVKNFIARLGGNAMSSGISREAYNSLSEWSSAFAEKDRTIITSLNISTDKESTVTETTEAVRSSGMCYLLSTGANEYIFETRCGRRMPRASGRVRIEWAGPGVIKKLHVTYNGFKPSEIANVLPQTVKDGDVIETGSKSIVIKTLDPAVIRTAISRFIK